MLTAIAYTVGQPGSAVYSFERGEYDLVWTDRAGAVHAPSGHLLAPVDAEVDGDFAAMRAAPYRVGAATVGEDDTTVLEKVYGMARVVEELRAGAK